MKKLAISLALAITMLFSVSTPALAFNPFGGVDCSKAPDSAVCNTNTTQLSGPEGLLIKITRIVAIISGIAAVIIIIISGLRYVTASGDPKNVESAKNTLIGAIVGLAVVIAAQAIITFVVSNL